MKITKITIENYKSIKRIEFSPNKWLNAFIGENSVGKSNIFNAINSLLGPTYPSFNSTTKQDHWEGDFNNQITIKLEYNDWNYFTLSENKEVTNYGKTEKKSGLFFNDQTYNCKWEIREKYCSAYLWIEREIQDYLPSNKRSLIGRILQQINEQFETEDMEIKGENWDLIRKSKKEVLKWSLEKIRDKVLFSVWRTEENWQKGIMDQFTEILQRESAKQLNREESSFTIDLSLYDPWNFYKTLQLLVKENDMDMQFQASSLGMWVQASITIAILKAYAELKLPNKTPIFIDEPELFLHPQAQRNFYKILTEMTEDKKDENGEITQEGLQIFYTTHSPNFLRTDKFNETLIVRKTKEKWTFINTANVADFVKDLKNRKNITSSEEDVFLHFKNAYENTGDSQKANEGFFAKKIILVEWQSESFILPYFFELFGFDFIRESISIVRCGCKNEIDRFFRLYNEFWIPCYIIFDGDKQNEWTQDEENTKNENKAIFDLFGIKDKERADNTVNDNFLWFEKKLEDNLNFTVTGNDKSIKLFQKVKENITKKEALPNWVWEIIEKINSLKDPLPSILKIEEELPF